MNPRTTVPSISVSGRFGWVALPGPPSMWSMQTIVAGTGISRIPTPGTGSAENSVMYVEAPSESTYSA